MIEHITTLHSDSIPRLDHKELKTVLEDLGVHDSFLHAELPNPCPIIEGLVAHKIAYQCTLCFLIRGSPTTLRKHYQQQHPDEVSPNLATTVIAQQLHHKNRTPYFRVYPEETSGELNAHLTFFQSVHGKRKDSVKTTKVSKVDPRMISVWLNTSQWHTLIEGLDPTHLISLVALPTKHEPELNGLQKAVEVYSSRADAAIDSLSHLARRCINSPDLK